MSWQVYSNWGDMSSGRQGNWAIIGFATVSLLLAVGGAFAAREEITVYQRTGTLTQRAKAITPAATIGLSSDSFKVNLTDCVLFFQRIGSLEARFETSETLTTVMQNCLAVADQVTRRAPSMSLSWFTGAYAAILLGDAKGFNERFVRSRLTGPTEQWMADLRISLAEGHLAALDGQSLAAHDDDLRLMVQSSLGLRNVALRYIKDEGFRERVEMIVETLPEVAQQRFLNNLNREVRDAGY